MKRAHDEQLDDVNEKKSRVDEDGLQEVRVLIDNPEASVIIGKAGANVKRIRIESGAFISILKNENPSSKERVMTVKGTVEKNASAFKLISELLIEALNEKNAKQGIATDAPVDSITLKLLIHKFLAGSVIGKGGEIIKAIQTETGVRMQISNDPLPASTEKTVKLTGTVDVIFAGVTRVLTQLFENPLRTGCSTALYVPGAPGTDPFAAASPYGGVPGYGGYAPPGYPPAAAPYGAQAPYAPPAAAAYPPAAAAPTGPTKTEKIVIPTVCAGTVIGKGGSIIGDIKRQSGAQITIAAAEPTAPDDRIVSITGTSQGISTAIYMIRQRVESYTPPM